MKSFAPIYNKEDICASRVYEFDNTPNKPKQTPKIGGKTIQPTKNSLFMYENQMTQNNKNVSIN